MKATAKPEVKLSKIKSARQVSLGFVRARHRSSGLVRGRFGSSGACADEYARRGFRPDKCVRRGVHPDRYVAGVAELRATHARHRADEERE